MATEPKPESALPWREKVKALAAAAQAKHAAAGRTAAKKPPPPESVPWQLDELGADEDELVREPGDTAVILDIVTVGDVAPERVRWLWRHRIPFGKLSLLEGMPDVGKSNLSLKIAAMLTIAGVLPDGEKVELGSVLIVTVEDGIADTIRPRLEAAGADVNRVHVLRSVGESERIPKIPDDLPAIREAIIQTHATLVIIDTLGSHTSAKRKGGDDVDMGDALSAVAKIAEETGAAILALRHLQKAPVGNAITAGLGGIGVIGRARSCLLAARDPDDPTRRILARVKCNLAPPVPSLAYTIEGVEVPGAGNVSRILWSGQSAYTADQLIAATRDQGGRSELDEACDWLREQLAGGPKEKKGLVRLASAAGIATRTLERAKEKLKVEHKRQGFGEKMTVEWSIPATPSAQSPIYPPDGETEGKNGSNPAPNKDIPVSPRVARLRGPEGSRKEEIPRDLEQGVIDLLARENEAQSHA